MLRSILAKLQSMFERVASSQIRSTQTDDITGTDYVALDNVPCSQVIIYNRTGTTLLVGYRSSDPTNFTSVAENQSAMEVDDGVAQPLRGITNANQIVVKRSDESTVAVQVLYVAEG